MSKYKLLAIAPYEGFKGFFLNAVEERDDVEAVIYSASLRETADLVHNLDLSKFDVIICRGRSGRIVKEEASIPVVNVEFSSFDLLRSLELAQYSSHKKIAFVSFFNLGNNVQLLCSLLNYKTPIITPVPPASPEEMEALVRRLHDEEGVEIFVGDGACTHVASAIGAETILVTSGPESMRKAISEAVEICKYKYQFMSINDFHKTIIEQSHLPLAVFDSNKELVYSNLFVQKYCEDIHSRLRKYVSRVFHYQQMKCLVSNDTHSWKANGEVVSYQDQNYALFYLAEALPRNIQKNNCYEVIDPGQAAKCISLITNTAAFHEIWGKASSAAGSKLPLLIYGPSGMGKTTFAYAVYASGPYSQYPLIAIDCCLLDSKMFSRLFTDDRSPLFESNYTVLFKNVNTLSLSLQNQLHHYMLELELTKRNRVIATFSGDIGKLISCNIISKELCDLLSGITIQVPHLHEMADELPSIARSLINKLNQQLPIQLTGFEPGALELLKQHHWQSGIVQFELVLKHLAATSTTPYITTASVAEILAQTSNTATDDNSGLRVELDLNKPLDGITKDIVNLVLKEENMNQTRTAKRLNISRSTLWKKLQE